MTNDQIENNYPKAFLATGLIMAVLMGLCYFIVFHAPPKEADGIGGILVNYGTTDEGSGSDIMSMEEVSAAEKANHTKPDKVTTEPPTDKPTPSEKSDQNVVTQNTEDAPVVAANSKKPSTTVATETAKPAPKQTVNQNALYKGKTSTGSGSGDGTTDKPGNQGSPNGSTLSDNYGPGGSGNGLSLPNWHVVDPPNVKNVHRVEGTVVIDFTIDERGNVLEAHSNKQRTKAGLDLVQSCVDAIKNTKFVSSTTASGNQTGHYAFIFKVD
ncbi:MAG: energy transducer TonB [Bacteroidota bacterium]